MNEQSIGSNPKGTIGRFAGRLMNLIHYQQYMNIIRNIYVKHKNKNINILDIGCGGGIAVKHFSKYFNESKIYGIDISLDMVNLASRTNKKTIKEGRVKILLNNVEKIEIRNDTINIVTIFDNINFWTDYDKAFSEIKRIIRKDGIILIINEYPEIGTKWYNFVKFKNVDDYKTLLEKHGFDLNDFEIRKHTIIIRGILC